ncbi:histone acetyltransferase 1 [Arctopsyche grandis]|uniref:histone acetyltransferase 1 n=1 Tax=Arctopsyche grandis TaxID=121162 RepID=UPI00406D7222
MEYDAPRDIMETLAHLVVDANDVLHFKLVRAVEDIEDDEKAFGPDMSHQVFGENENIFGYTDLNIRLYYTAASLQTYLGITYSDKIDPVHFDGVKPDNIADKISPMLAPNYHTNIDDFVKSLMKDDDFVPYGDLIHSFSIDNFNGVDRKFEVYFCETKTPNFLNFHTRLQTFLLWYVDAASFIDIEDDQWTFFILYEQYNTCDGNRRWAVAGMSTVYRYYAWPFHTRPRISQALVLPPFQRNGLGAQLLQAIYSHYVSFNSVIDITVEDPSDDFQRLRDYVDAQNCETLPAFNPKILFDGYNKDMATQAQSKFKINNKQARRVYEILRLRHTDTTDVQQYKMFRLDVKNRLNAPFQKKKNDMKKLQKVLKPEEYAATLSTFGVEETFQRLNVQYQSLETHYKKVIDRLDS